MPKLAIRGGTPVRNKPWPTWPVWDRREEENLLRVLHSGAWGIGGTAIEQFEREFAALCGAKHAITCTSGTTGLEVSLRAVGVTRGAEVIVPAYTFMATATCVLTTGASIMWADICEDTFCIDPASVEQLITERTKAVIPVHMGGAPADLDRLLEICRPRGIAVVEDAAQAHLARYNGRPVGAIGDLGAFSFQSSKNISSGEGGAIVTNDDRLAEMAWSIHNCGRARGGGWYEHPVMGTNVRMTEWQAAVLLAQIQRAEKQTQRRRENAAYLDSLLAEIDGVEPARVHGEDSASAYHLYLLRYNPECFKGLPREKFVQAVRAEGVELTCGYGKPLYHHDMFQPTDGGPCWAERICGVPIDFSGVRCPVAEKIGYETGMWIYQKFLLGERSDMDDIAEAIRKVQENVDELLE